MSEYRDALSTAKERVARLEALVEERGLTKPRRPPVRIGVVIFLVATAVVSGCVQLSRRIVQSGNKIEVLVDQAMPPPISTPAPPRVLTWYEPGDSWNPQRGPLEAWSKGTRLLVGMLWQRGERKNGLYVAAFDADTLSVRWKAGPFDSEWTGQDEERFHILVDRGKVVLSDSAGVVRVFDVGDGSLVGKADIRRGTDGMCHTVRGPRRIMLGFGAHNEANTAHALFPWELDRIQPFYFDPNSFAVTKAPQAPPEKTWCGTADYCDEERKDGCHDELSTWHYGDRRVVVKRGKENSTVIVGSTYHVDADPTDNWNWPLDADADTTGESAIGESYFFHAFLQNGTHRIVAVDHLHGATHFVIEPAVRSGARMRRLSTVTGNQLFALYDDDMLVFDGAGRLNGKLEAP